MPHLDRHDLPLSTTSGHAAQRYREGLDLMLSMWPGAAAALDEAIALDPDFALAHAARARLHARRGETAQARQTIQAAASLAARRGTERERHHVEVLSLVIHGESAKALEQALAHAERWPRDVLVLSLLLGAFGLLAFSGRPDHDQARVDLCERHARHFGDDDWWFLTYRGWSHGENGNVALGRSLAERALELRRNNANGVHALAHVLHEAGAGDDVDRLVDGWLPGYDRGAILHGHIAWHAALVALERGDTGRALALYRDHIAPSANLGVPVNVVSDAASFLWRLHAYGHAVPAGLWADAARYAAGFFQQPGFAFADVHMALVAAATGDHAALERRAAALSALAMAGKLAAGHVVPAICRAARAFMEEDYAACVRLLEPMAGEVARIGGSGAQREIVEDTLLVALMRSGEAPKARALLERRLHRRLSVRDAAWRRQLDGASLQPRA